MKTLGVIGGMGPEATAHFYHLFTKLCLAACDQEHPDAVILSRPRIPDRTAYILGKQAFGKNAEDPAPALIDAGKTLTALGADFIAIPCVTAHFFYDRLVEALTIPVVHIIRETAGHLFERGIKRAGLLATEGTVKSGIFHKELNKLGIETIIPSAESQNLLMELTYSGIKAGLRPDLNIFDIITSELLAKGSETIILGCTELSLVNRGNNIGALYTDPLEILARRALALCGAKISL